MQIEMINIGSMSRKLFHYTSSEQKKIKLDSDSMMKDALKYIEDRINEGGLELHQYSVTESGTGFMLSFILAKK